MSLAANDDRNSIFDEWDDDDDLDIEWVVWPSL